MALTPSNMLPLGTKARDFKLLEPATGEIQTLGLTRGKQGLVVMFICNHCPYVKHIQKELVALGNEYLAKGIGMVAINANDVVAYPEDAPEKMIDFKQEINMQFPYLFDDSQETARHYDASCTPDFFLFDAELSLVYRGQFDGSRPGNQIAVSGEDLKKAMDCLLYQQPIPEEQIPSMGCNIKWKGA